MNTMPVFAKRAIYLQGLKIQTHKFRFSIMYRTLGILLFISFGMLNANSQDTLPDFKLINKGNNRIVISWANPYGTGIRQLSIQRSVENSRNFRTILTLPDPTVPQNGFVDTKSTDSKAFYRLYILLDSGKYVFSKAKRPVLDTSKTLDTGMPLISSDANTDVNSVKPENKVGVTPRLEPEKIIYIKKRDTLIAKIGERFIKKYKDSVAIRTKDTISYNGPDTLIIKPFVAKEVFKPSQYVFTDKDGNIKMILPDAIAKKYTIKFIDEDNSVFFEIKQITSPDLTIDKANFLKAGWFKFELYEDAQLKEKNKLYISKDF
jgi:hypothetical protein